MKAESAGAAFLLINPSARTAALGNSGTATSNDVGSIFTNPAGLRSTPGRQFMASQMALFGNDSFSSIGYSHSLASKNTLGVGVVYLRRGDIEGRNEFRQETGNIPSSDMAVQLSYGFSAFSQSSIGVSVKSLQQKIGGDKAQGVALDLGFQSPLSRRMNFGLSLTNLGPQMKFSSEKYSLPARATAGLSYNAGAFALMADFQNSLRDHDSDVLFGVEFQPIGMLSIRSGYVQGLGSQSGEVSASSDGVARFANLTAGLGLHLGLFQMDYAMVPHAALAASHLLTISGKFK